VGKLTSKIRESRPGGSQTWKQGAKLKSSNLKQSIDVKPVGEGRSRQYKATCPICLFTFSVAVLSSESSAEFLACHAMQSHINSRHKTEIDIDS